MPLPATSYLPAIKNVLDSDWFNGLKDEDRQFGLEAFRKQFVEKNGIDSPDDLNYINETSQKEYDDFRHARNIPRYTPTVEQAKELLGNINIKPDDTVDNKIKAIEDWRDKGKENAAKLLPANKEDLDVYAESLANEYTRQVLGEADYGKDGGFSVKDLSKRFVEGLGAKEIYNLINYQDSQRFFAKHLVENPQNDESTVSQIAGGAGQFLGQGAIALTLGALDQPELITPTFFALYGATGMQEAYQREIRRTGDELRATNAMVDAIPGIILDVGPEGMVAKKAIKAGGIAGKFADEFIAATTHDAKRAVLKEFLPSILKEGIKGAASEGIIGGAGANIAYNLGDYAATNDPKYLKNAQDIGAIAQDGLVSGILGGVFGAGYTALGKVGANQNVSSALQFLTKNQVKQKDIFEALKSKDYNKVIDLVNGKTMSQEDYDKVSEIMRAQKEAAKVSSMPSNTEEEKSFKEQAKEAWKKRFGSESGVTLEEVESYAHNSTYTKAIDGALERAIQAKDSVEIERLTKARAKFFDESGLKPVKFNEQSEFDSNLTVSNVNTERKIPHQVTLQDKSTIDSQDVVFVNPGKSTDAAKRLKKDVNLAHTINGEIQFQSNGKTVKFVDHEKAPKYEASPNPHKGWIPIRVGENKITLLSPVSEYKAVEQKQEQKTQTKDTAQLSPAQLAEKNKQNQQTEKKEFDSLLEKKINNTITPAELTRYNELDNKFNPTETIDQQRVNNVTTKLNENLPPDQQVSAPATTTKKRTKKQPKTKVETSDAKAIPTKQKVEETPKAQQETKVEPANLAEAEQRSIEYDPSAHRQTLLNAIAYHNSIIADENSTDAQKKRSQDLIDKFKSDLTEVESKLSPEQTTQQNEKESQKEVVQKVEKQDEEVLAKDAESQSKESDSAFEISKLKNKIEGLLPIVRGLDSQYTNEEKEKAKSELKDAREKLKQLESSTKTEEEVLKERIDAARSLNKNIILQQRKDNKQNTQRREEQTKALESLANDVGLKGLTIVNTHEELNDPRLDFEHQAFVEGGKATFILDNIVPYQGESHVEAIQRIFKHEIVGHLKVSQVLSGISPEGFKNLVKFLKKQTYKSGVNVWKEREAAYKTEEERTPEEIEKEIVDEIFAKLAEMRDKKSRNLIEKIINWIRINLLKSGNANWTANDIDIIMQEAFHTELASEQEGDVAFSKQDTRRGFIGGLFSSLIVSQNISAGETLNEAMKGVGTKLTKEEETKFQEWKKIYAPLDSGADYDLRGAFKEGITPDGERGHFPDTYKFPNHPTFSKESKYSTKEHTGGEWGERNGHPTFTPSEWMAEDYGRMEELKKYFKKVEPDSELIIPAKKSNKDIRYSKNVDAIHLNSSLKGMYGAWIGPTGKIIKVGYQDHLTSALNILGEEFNAVDDVYREMGNRGYLRAVNLPQGVWLEGNPSAVQRAVVEFIGINDEKKVYLNDKKIYSPPEVIRFSKQDSQQEQSQQPKKSALDYLYENNDIASETKTEAVQTYGQLLKQLGRLEQKLIINEVGVKRAFEDIQYAHLGEDSLNKLLEDLTNFVETRTRQKEPSTNRTNIDDLQNRLGEYKKEANLGEYNYWKEELARYPDQESIPDWKQFFNEDIDQFRSYINNRLAIDSGEGINPKVEYTEEGAATDEAIMDKQFQLIDNADKQGDIINRYFAGADELLKPSGDTHLDGLRELAYRRMMLVKKIYTEFILSLATTDSTQLNLKQKRLLYYQLMSVTTDGYPNGINNFISNNLTNMMKSVENNFVNPFSTKNATMASRLENVPITIARVAANRAGEDAMARLQANLREGLKLAKQAHEQFITPYVEGRVNQFYNGVLDANKGNQIGMFMHLRQRFLTENTPNWLKLNHDWIKKSNKNLRIFDKGYNDQANRHDNYLANFFDNIDLEKELTQDDIDQFNFNAEKMIGKEGIAFADSIVEMFDSLKPLSKFTSEFIYGRTFDEIVNYVPSMSVIIKGDGKFEVDNQQYQFLTDNKAVRSNVSNRFINTTGAGYTKEREQDVGQNRTLVLNPQNLAVSSGRLLVYDAFTSHERQEISQITNPKTTVGNIFQKFLGDGATKDTSPGALGRYDVVSRGLKDLWNNELSQVSYIHPWHSLTNWFARKRAQGVLSGAHQLPAQGMSNLIPYFVQHINEPRKIGNFIKAMLYWVKYISGNLLPHQMRLVDDVLFEIRYRQQETYLDKSINLNVNPNSTVEFVKKELPLLYKAVRVTDKLLEKALLIPFKASDILSGTPMMLAEYLNEYQDDPQTNRKHFQFEDLTYDPKIYIKALDKVERYIGIGDASRRGEFLGNKNAGIAIARNLLVAFRSFTLNNAGNFSAEYRKLTSNEVSQELRLESMKYMTGIVAQSVVFSGMKIAIAGMVLKAIISAYKNPQDEEELKKLYKKAQGRIGKGERAALEAEISMREAINKTIKKVDERNINKRIIVISTIKDALPNMVLFMNLDFIPDMAIHIGPDTYYGEEFKAWKQGEQDRLNKLIKRNKNLGNTRTAAQLTEELRNIEMQEFLPAVFEHRGISNLGGAFGGVAKELEDMTNSAGKFYFKPEAIGVNDFLNLASVLGVSQPDIKKYFKTGDAIDTAKRNRDEKLKEIKLSK